MSNHATQEREWINSLALAEYFCWKHEDLLRRIDSTWAGLPKQWAKTFFKEAHYLDNNNQQKRAVEMDRDGYTVLGIGFVTEKAPPYRDPVFDMLIRESKSE